MDTSVIPFFGLTVATIIVSERPDRFWSRESTPIINREKGFFCAKLFFAVLTFSVVLRGAKELEAALFALPRTPKK